MTWPTTTESGAEPDEAGPEAPGGGGSHPLWQRLWNRAVHTWRTPPWRRGRIVAGIAVLFTLPMAFHGLVPNSPGHWGSFIETFLPWGGLIVPPLLIAAAVRRSWTALVATALPIAVWLAMFGAFFLPGRGGGPHDVRIVSHNVNAVNPDPEATARTLLKDDPDVIALEELPEGAFKLYGRVLDAEYPHMRTEGTVAVWSRFPIGDSTPVDVGMGFTRALRVEVTTPKGPFTLYVAHLASVRIGPGGFSSGDRDRTIDRLAESIAADRSERVVLVGDLNGTTDDRALSPLTRHLRDTQDAAGTGMGFTWPASFPMAAIDHVMTRGMTAADAKVLGETPSDHLPVQADLRLR